MVVSQDETETAKWMSKLPPNGSYMGHIARYWNWREGNITNLK